MLKYLELKLLQKKGFISPHTHLLTVEDPAENIGSGAATLNALLIVTEYLSLQNGYTIITADVLQNVHILILHYGREYIFDPCGKAFINVPYLWSCKESNNFKKLESHGIYTSMEILLDTIDMVSNSDSYGIRICSTDMLLWSGTEGCYIKDQEIAADVKLFYVYADIKYATGHGVIKMDSSGVVQDIIYCGKEELINCYSNEMNKVPLVAGIVYLSSCVAETLLALHTISPLDSCNYMGLDSGAEPLQVSLFFDILITMASDIDKEKFLSGKCGKRYNKKFGISNESKKRMIRARSVVWEQLSQYKMIAVCMQNCSHIYWTGENAKQHIDVIRGINKQKIIHSYLEMENTNINDSIILNSSFKISHANQISSGSIVYHTSILADSLYIGKNCFLNGLKIHSPQMKITIPDSSVIIGFKVSLPNEKNNSPFHINVIFGLNDSIKIPVTDSQSTFCNLKWHQIFAKTGINADDIWDKNLEEGNKSLLNAKLYCIADNISEYLSLFNPEENWNKEKYYRWRDQNRLSLNNILQFQQYQEEFKCRRELYASIACRYIDSILKNDDHNPILPYLHAACTEGWEKRVIELLDTVCEKSVNATPVICRILSCIADLLSIMAGKSGGVRSGPGNNKLWTPAFNLLREGNLQDGLSQLKTIRNQWLDYPYQLIRAARHYESALQIIVGTAVTTARQFISLSKIPLLSFEQYVMVECPARIDLQGGWTDTPPICYELGGSVVNIAVLIDDIKPIGAKACRIKNLEIQLILGKTDTAPIVVVNHINQLTDYNQPNAEAALLKAAIVYVGLVDMNTNIDLSQQLKEKYGGGFKIQAWSLLPQGSGLGTSSIIASAIISALWTIIGYNYDNKSVLHAVLQLEQLLTTGGGWQDQVGGVMGGIQRGYCQACLPLCIQTEEIKISEKFLRILNKHILLLYTGKVRLAKNLLQNVIRNWYAKEESIVGCFKNLLQNSLDMVEAFNNEDLEKIGDLLNIYWKHKQQLAPGCQPFLVGEMMSVLKPLSYGQCLVGAGGGGYMCIITRQPNAADSIRNTLSQIKGTDRVSIHQVSIHLTEMAIQIGTVES